MRARISKWGNSLALRLPKKFAATAHLHEGTAVDLQIEGESLIITRSRPKLILSDLLSRMKPEHRHAEVDWNGPRGAEEW